MSESIADAKNAQSENDHITEAITKTWEDTLKAQEESAQAEATAAEVRSAATAKVAEAAVEHDKAAKSISEEAAAQAVASIRAKQYAADIVVLIALLNEVGTNPKSRRGYKQKAKRSAESDNIIRRRGCCELLIAAPISKDNAQSIDNEAEKFAHGLFDPLFDLGEKWDRQWKQIRATCSKTLGRRRSLSFSVSCSAIPPDAEARAGMEAAHTGRVPEGTTAWWVRVSAAQRAY